MTEVRTRRPDAALRRRLAAVLIAGLAVCAAVGDRAHDLNVHAQAATTFDPSLFQELRWRHIGPFRGGRTKAAAGVPSQPHVFYIGAVNGGVWKTDDAGRTWTPIFDDQPTGSIGAIAVAPSDPNVVYVGSGEGLQRPDLSTGDGIYKSTDAGRTWRQFGLRDGQQIPQIVVDPRDPNRLFVAVLGHPYGPNAERGVFRSTNGGESFDRVLFRDENTGAADIVLDPQNSATVYAALWEARQGPWENAAFTGPGSGVHKTTDGGATWRPLVNGLPTFVDDGLGRVGLTVAPSQPARLFATVEARRRGGLYRSDDAGESWTLVNADPRVTMRGSDFAEVKVDPGNPDIVYTGSIVAWKSTDGGRSFTAWRGAPGGDDYHRIWINPQHPDIVLLASDQGAVITLNGGETWSSWYNQPTAQFYHVSTDNAFPYRVCGGQQESGSACVASRSDEGRIGPRDWRPVGVEEYGYVAPDPADPDVVYGGKVTRFDRRTRQTQDVSPPRGPGYRVLRTAPLLFSPDGRTLYFGANTLWRTTNGGQVWTEMSPDLSRETWQPPGTVAAYLTAAGGRPTRRGVIYTIAPSSIDRQTIWAGTDDGLIHVTRDAGRTWHNVTPDALVPWAKVSLLEASHFDVNTAYAAVNTLRLDDLRPAIYRTRDGGRSWKLITAGLPDGAAINVVREDSFRRGLLFAGSERAVHLSFDDGESWQSLRLNMPATSIRDLVIKDHDLVAGTHGRGFWILDDISPLRQITPDVARAPAFLFQPPTAWRFRSNKNRDTPVPPDEPTAPNPPDGVTISYLVGPEARGPVTLEIVEALTGHVIRKYSSDDPPEPPPPADRNFPDYWLGASPRLLATPGLHRFVWDVRHAPPPSDRVTYPIAATPGGTPRLPLGVWAMPETYQVRLTVGGRVLRQAVSVRLDPRVRVSAADLQLQFKLSQSIDARLREISTDLAHATPAQATALRETARGLIALFTAIQQADARPTAAQEAAVAAAIAR